MEQPFNRVPIVINVIVHNFRNIACFDPTVPNLIRLYPHRWPYITLPSARTISDFCIHLSRLEGGQNRFRTIATTGIMLADKNITARIIHSLSHVDVGFLLDLNV